MPKILIVGCGFAGAVYARTLAEAGCDIDMIDQRDHIGGNAFDEIHPTGVRIHRYGPHLFHTSNKTVVDWLAQFGEFVPYHHKVQAVLPNGGFVPLPINRQTINTVFGVNLKDPEAVADFLKTQARDIAEPANAYEYLAANIGDRLTNLFFRPYTKKMWQLDLESIDASVVKRIPLRLDDEDRYFPNDTYQIMPRHGYTRVFENILDHPRITVTLSQAFDKTMLPGLEHCFNSMPIDQFYENRFGPLPYRSIRFHHYQVPAGYAQGTAATINFTDDGAITRETDWSRLPFHAANSASKIVTREEPCDYIHNNHERYYPVRTSDGRYQAVYALYKDLAAATGNVTFIGRCGTYQYLDMHQVINQSLLHVTEWIRRHPVTDR